MEAPASVSPSASGSAQDRILVVRDAAVVPPLGHGPMQKGLPPGVFRRDGSFIDEANIERSGRLLLRNAPLLQQPTERLTGRHLYAGQLSHHFGHFLCESLSRLWALDQARDIGSVLFLPRRKGSEREFQGFQNKIFSLLNISAEVRVIDTPVTVDELIVPDQGFGNGRLCAGTPAFIDYIHGNFAKDIAPEGPEDLYISREGLALFAGSILGEGNLSANLTAQGYTEFQPEKHDLATQIARFRAARRVVAVEGSALHLLGLVAQPGLRVALIARRSDKISAQAIASQLRAFCGAEVEILDHITREWNLEGRETLSSKSISEIDYAALGRDLAEKGFTEKKKWRVRPVNVERRLGRISSRTGRNLIPYLRSDERELPRPST